MNFLKNLISGQIIKGYTTQGEAITGVGVHKSWKLYKGKKDSTNTQVSIFVIQKKLLRHNKEQILKSAKKQVLNLAKIRHPGVLAVVQPLFQDENVMAFVTQKVEGSLSILIKNKKIQQFLSSELQLKLNLFPLLETIEFLHQIVKMCHLGVCLDSIYITADGKWKIAGLNYTQQITTDQEQVLECDFYDYAHCAPQVVRLIQQQKNHIKT